MRHGRTIWRLESNRRSEFASSSYLVQVAAAAEARQMEIISFQRDKWRAITSAARHFGLDPQRPHVVEVTAPRCRSVLGVTSVDYLSNGHMAPAVGLHISILGANIAGRLDSDGNLHLASNHSELSATYRILLNLAVVLHYFDLVMRHMPERVEATAQSRSIESEGDHIRVTEGIRTIPRPHNADRPNSPANAQRQSFREQSVDPFRRRLPTGQTPTFEKIVEADQYGINLQGPGYPDVQYTFVREHTRGRWRAFRSFRLSA